MPTIKANGIEIYYEEAGNGTPLIFVHEFAGDYRSWEPQIRFFSRRYRAITYSARGYHPSEIPADPDAYSQQTNVEDLKGLMDALGIETAHICGLSMGSFTTLWFGLTYPARALSLTIAGSGYGSGSDREEWQKSTQVMGEIIQNEGMEEVGRRYAVSAARVQYQNKDPRGFAEFMTQFLEHAPVGSANTFLRIQAVRPRLQDLAGRMRELALPALILLGDEDTTGLEGSLFMKETIPRAGLEIFPRSGHLINLEEPARFNRSLLEFITAVEAGHWEPRDPRTRQGH